MSVAASLALAMLAYTILSAGQVLMKKGIAWIGWRGPKDGSFRARLAVWAAGFVLANAYIVPSTVALKTLAPHAVAAMAGWGVVVLILLSRALLGERLRRSDFAHAVLIVAGIAALNVFERSGPDRGASGPVYIGIALVPLALAMPGSLRAVSRRSRAVLLAAASGISAGLIVLTMKILVSAHGFRVAAYFASPYFYAYLAFSLGAFIALQGALKLGDMMAVGPVQYSAAILYPVLGSALLFGRTLRPVQAAAVAVVVLGVAAMLRRRQGSGRGAAFSGIDRVQ